MSSNFPLAAYVGMRRVSVPISCNASSGSSKKEWWTMMLTDFHHTRESVRAPYYFCCRTTTRKFYRTTTRTTTRCIFLLPVRGVTDENVTAALCPRATCDGLSVKIVLPLITSAALVRKKKNDAKETDAGNHCVKLSRKLQDFWAPTCLCLP